MKIKLVLILLLLSFKCFSEISIDSTSAGNNLAEKEAWGKATKGFSYPDVKQQQKKKFDPIKKNKKEENLNMPGWIKYPIFIFILAILVLLISRIIIILLRPSDKKVTNNIAYEELPDDFFPEEEYEAFLKRSLTDGNLKNAVRFSFLIALRNLADKKLIYRSREKTNFDYLSELSSHPAFMPFRAIAHAYEIVWYGELVPDSESYKAFEHKFYELNTLIATTNKL